MQLLSLLFVSALALSSSAFQHGIGKNRYQPVVKVSSSIATTSATTAVAPAATQSGMSISTLFTWSLSLRLVA
jgi:hypothetical protein